MTWYSKCKYFFIAIQQTVLLAHLHLCLNLHSIHWMLQQPTVVQIVGTNKSMDVITKISQSEVRISFTHGFQYFIVVDIFLIR
jgi:hypothetical protein